VSKFHNSVGGEKLALAYHAFGILLGAVMTAADVFVMTFYYATPHLASYQFLFDFALAGGLVCAVYHTCMTVWHINATIDHVEHMGELKAAAYLEET
jgi:hypothetical protein